MSTLKKLQEKNPNRKIVGIEDAGFQVFGRLLNIKPTGDMVEFMLNEADFPQERNVYVASEPQLEKYDMKEWLTRHIYSGMECQIGYCNGLVSQINGFEFHQCSEVYMSMTDSILALTKAHTPVGSPEPYRIEDSILWYVPAGTGLELYPMTGHFSPIRVHESGYRTVIVLLKGTNEPLGLERTQIGDDSGVHKNDSQAGDKGLGFAMNKWLYVHEDRMDLVMKGAHLHVLGDNSPIEVI